MAYRIELVEEKEYLRATLEGAVSRAEHEEFRAAALTALKGAGWWSILIDVTGATPEMSWADDFEYTSGHQAQLPPRLRTAILHAPEAAEKFRFVENVALNRGVNMRAFVDEAAALAWLLDR